MRTNFEIAQGFTSPAEGGYANNPKDPGGPTNYGVSLRWLRSQGYDIGDIDGDGDIDIDDIKALTPERAAMLFHSRFWEPHHLDDYPLLPAIAHYDCMVNAGPGSAGRVLQAACNFHPGYMPLLAEDGVVGPLTRKRMWEIVLKDETAPLVLAKVMVAERERFYGRLTSRRPDLMEFYRGWMNRCANLTNYLEKQQ